MTVAFVVINTAPGKEHEVYVALQQVPQVTELHPLFGEFDLIAKLEAVDFDSLGQLIVCPGPLGGRVCDVHRDGAVRRLRRLPHPADLRTHALSLIFNL